MRQTQTHRATDKERDRDRQRRKGKRQTETEAGTVRQIDGGYEKEETDINTDRKTETQTQCEEDHGTVTHLISSRLCPSTTGCSPPSMSSIFVCLLLS